jgi:phosphonate ABC transporter permease subunit PhnE
MKNQKKEKPSAWKSLSIGGIVLLVLVIYAYGFQITKVNLEELRSETRQASLQRVIRALAKPEIFEYEQTEQIINFPIYVPCLADGSLPTGPDHSGSQPYLILTPGCASPGESVQVEGFNFAPYVSGPVRFVPGSDVTNIVTLGREVAETDNTGHFVLSMELPNRPSEEVQYIRATLYRNVGSPHFTQTAKDTWEKIIETVFLALLATTFGTFLAIPLSFLAARNLMVPVRSPLTSISLSLIGWPIGIYAGFMLVRWVGNFNASLNLNPWLGLLTIFLVLIIDFLGIRWALPKDEGSHSQSKSMKVLRLGGILGLILISFFGFFQLARLVMKVGQGIIPSLGSFGFLGNFMFQVGDIVLVVTSVIGALAAGGAVSSILSRLGQQASESLPASGVKLINLILTPIALATLLVLGGQLIQWLYQINQSLYTLWGPMITGFVIGLLLAILTKAKDALPTGMVIYYITRTFLNGLRSIEALVMAIVFVIAVGIGPFAGVMALGLHTIVSLAKLYSEQVESIMSGPLEAIQATGANRLQTIIYAVVPQIVPPYISYTMYRWDINVRMSTIIGFVGGGGIGFLLQQNINLLNYRAASAQMLAIAIVVASMDYISSVLREKTI